MSDRVGLAVSAVRHATSGEASGAACYTRSRVLAAVRQRKRRRVLNVTFGIPLAAVLMGSVAWAASGQNLPHMVRYVSAALARTSMDRAHTAPSSAQHPTRARSKSVAPRSPIERTESTNPSAVVALEPARVERDAPDAAGANHAAAALRVHVAETKRQTEVTERELHLYESGHRAHFVEKNWAAALSAWEEYLHEVPRGHFAMEARYNRALCLVRLGMTEQALNALRPFALNSVGSYRQKEARELIERIERGVR